MGKHKLMYISNTSCWQTVVIAYFCTAQELSMALKWFEKKKKERKLRYDRDHVWSRLKYLSSPLQKEFANFCLKHFNLKHVNIYSLYLSPYIYVIISNFLLFHYMLIWTTCNHHVTVKNGWLSSISYCWT